jgi:hypothetical protein
MEILEACDQTGSFRDAAELAGCSHHTMAPYLARREAEVGPEYVLTDNEEAVTVEHVVGIASGSRQMLDFAGHARVSFKERMPDDRPERLAARAR